MRRFVLTCDSHAWLLKGFFHQWEKYDNRPIEAVGFGYPGPKVIGDHPFVSLGKFADYPASRWSDALIEYLHSLEDELVELYLEDYWLIRETNRTAVMWAESYMQSHRDVLRFDLASDRMYAKGARDVDHFGFLDIVEAPGAQYNMSTQASIFRRPALLEILTPGESAWEAELLGNNRVNTSRWRVLGTRQLPVYYQIVMVRGKFERSGAWMYPPREITPADWAELERDGCCRP